MRRQGTFTLNNFDSAELEEELGLSAELLEDLEGSKVIITEEVHPGYYDVYFPTMFDNDENVLEIEALSFIHLKNVQVQQDPQHY